MNNLVFDRVLGLYHRCKLEIGNDIFIGVPIYYLEEMYLKEYQCHIVEDIYDENKMFIGFVYFLKLHPNTIILTQCRSNNDSIPWVIFYDENDPSFERSMAEIKKLQFCFERIQISGKIIT